MIASLLVASALGGEIPVGAGESVAGAVAEADDGDVIVVSAGADLGGTIILNEDITVTIRSDTGEIVDIPPFDLQRGVLILEHVRVHAISYGSAAIVGKITGGTLKGHDIELDDGGTSAFGLRVDPGVVEIDGLRMHDSNNTAVYVETDAGPSTVTIRDLQVTGSGNAAILTTPGPYAPTIRVTESVLEGNRSKYALFYIQGAAEVELSRVQFLGNQPAATAPVAWSLNAGASLKADHLVLCGNTGTTLFFGAAGTTQTVTRSLFSTHGAPQGTVGRVYGSATFAHNTWIGTGDQAILDETAATYTAEMTSTNELFDGFGPASVEQGLPVAASHPMWVGDNAPGWVQKAPGAQLVEEAGFVDRFLRTDCATLPLLTEGSAAFDAGDPEVPLEDGDVGQPDIGAFPVVVVEVEDTDTDVIPADEVSWISGGGGCATVGGPSWLLALISAGCASAATARGPARRRGGPAPRR